MFQRMNEIEIALYVERVMTKWGIYLEDSGAEFPDFELKPLECHLQRMTVMQYKVLNRFETLKVYYTYGQNFETLTIHHIGYPVPSVGHGEKILKEVRFHNGFANE